VKNVLGKAVRMSKNVKIVKDKAVLFKCSKWVQECINKFKKIVISVKGKVKLLVKEVNVKFVMGKRLWKNKKLWR
jgi:hypothetical protein